MTNRSQKPCPIEVFPRLTSPIDRNLFKGEPAPVRKMADDVVRVWAKLRIRVKSLSHELSDRQVEAVGVRIPLEHPIQDRSGHPTSIGWAPSECGKQGSRAVAAEAEAPLSNSGAVYPAVPDTRPV